MITMLVDWAVRSSILILGAALALRLLRVKDASMRSAAWTAILCASLAIPALTRSMPALAFPAARAVASAPAPAIAAIPEPSLVLTPPRNARMPFDWTVAASILYALVAIALVARLPIGLALSLRLLYRSRATGRTVDGIEIRESDRVASPVTLGILRPAIVLPSDWRDWTTTNLDAVLAHECAHVRRRDPAVQLLSSIHRAILWHSPLAWYLHRQIVRTAEQSSDDAAIAATGDRAGYAELLLDFTKRGARRIAWIGVPMARYGGPHQHTQRIHRILDSTTLSRAITWPRVFAILALTAPVTYVVTAVHAQSAPARPPALDLAAPAQPAIPEPAAQSQPKPAAPRPQRNADHIEALGAVTAVTVAIKPKIDGQLMSVSFTEGRAVEAGQLLATLDGMSAKLELDRAQAAFDAAQKMWDSAGHNDAASETKQAFTNQRINLALAQERFDSTQIRSPIAGVAGLRQVDVGNMVYAKPDAPPIVVITEVQPIFVICSVPEDELARLTGRGAVQRIEAWTRDDRTRLATGSLVAIDNQIDRETGAARVKATFDNKDGALFPNQFVNVRLYLQ